MRRPQQSARPPGNCYSARRNFYAGKRGSAPELLWEVITGTVRAVQAGNERIFMGPAIALRLRQHLTLTPQVQQALKLLQMSALEFGQEMEEALTANPFLEENPDAPPPASRDAATPDDVVVPQESSPGGSSMERDQDDWGGGAEAQPTLQQHLREQLMISPMGERD